MLPMVRLLHRLHQKWSAQKPQALMSRRDPKPRRSLQEWSSQRSQKLQPPMYRQDRRSRGLRREWSAQRNRKLQALMSRKIRGCLRPPETIGRHRHLPHQVREPRRARERRRRRASRQSGRLPRRTTRFGRHWRPRPGTRSRPKPDCPKPDWRRAWMTPSSRRSRAPRPGQQRRKAPRAIRSPGPSEGAPAPGASRQRPAGRANERRDRRRHGLAYHHGSRDSDLPPVDRATSRPWVSVTK
jgi:hypothetical protein